MTTVRSALTILKDWPFSNWDFMRLAVLVVEAQEVFDFRWHTNDSYDEWLSSLSEAVLETEIPNWDVEIEKLKPKWQEIVKRGTEILNLVK
jgi:hypothetical protein